MKIPKKTTGSMLSLFVLCMFTFFSAHKLQAQNSNSVIVSGTIVDEENVPLLGVSIIELNTSRGVVSDFDGNFSIQINKNSGLEITYIGYKTEVIKNIASSSSMNIKLKPDTNNLDEVIVVGFGTQTKQSLIGAVSTVKGETLQEVGSVNTISEALQGQAPGLTIINTDTRPGAAEPAEIYVRGQSTWGDSSALVLVDGIERDLNNIDPNEIESISILKDATSTAVYGTRGANGVVLVTTKRGKIGKPKFNFSSNFGFKQSTATPEYADYITTQNLYNEAALNDKSYTDLIPQSTIDAWTENYDQRGPDNIYFPEVDWADEVLGVGVEQTYNLNMSGGSKLVRYFVSLGHKNDGDIYKTVANEDFDPAFKLKRYNWRTNLDFDLTPTTKFSVNFAGNYRVRKQTGFRVDGGGEGGFGQSQFFSLLYNAPRNVFPIEYEDGYGDSSNGENNLYAQLNEGGERTFRYYQGIYDAELNQGLDFITQGLSVKGKVNYSSSSSYQSQILRGGVGTANFGVIRYYREFDYANPIVAEDGTTTYPILNEIRYPDDTSQGTTITGTTPSIFSYDRRLNYQVQFDYKRLFGDHKVSATALMLRDIKTGRNNPSFYREEWISRLRYNYKERYFLEANGSYAGSEQFSPNNRFGFFPSVGVSWVASEEPFMKKITGSWLDLLKFYYGYGQSGNDKVGTDQSNISNRFTYIQLFTSGRNINFGDESLTSVGPLYNEGDVANANASWETSTEHNFSVKLDMFKKLNISLELYKKERTGILMDTPTLAYVGITGAPSANLGETKTHGYDLEAVWSDKITDDLSYRISMATAFSENRVIYRADPRYEATYLNLAGKPISVTRRLLTSGLYQSLDDIYNGPTTTLGNAQNILVPGDVAYVDYNGDGSIVSTEDIVAMEHDTKLPLNTYSLGLRFKIQRILVIG